MTQIFWKHFVFDEISICDQKQLLKFPASSNKDVFKYVLYIKLITLIL